MPRSSRNHFLKKGFPKLDFLIAVSVTMIANSEKMKMKKSYPPYELCISSPLPFWFPPPKFLKIIPPTQFFENFIFPLHKRGENSSIPNLSILSESEGFLPVANKKGEIPCAENVCEVSLT